MQSQINCNNKSCVLASALRSRHTVWPHWQISISAGHAPQDLVTVVLPLFFLKRKGRIHSLSSCISLIFRMAVDLGSVLQLPNPDVSFGCSLEGRRGLCVFLRIIHKSQSLLKWTSTIADLERHVDCLRAYFSNFPAFPNILHSRLGSICVSLLEWARVSWILPGYLLFATFVRGLWNWRRTGMIIMRCYMRVYLCMRVHRVQSYYATFLPLLLSFFCFPLFGCLFFWWLIFLFFLFSFPRVPPFQIMTNIFSLN